MTTYQVIHTQYADGKGYRLGFVNQMGNIASEVGRTLMYKAQGKQERMMSAFWRMLELIDWTLQDPHNTRNQKRELTRGRELLCDYIVGDNRYGSRPENLDKYFYQFALMARAEK